MHHAFGLEREMRADPVLVAQQGGAVDPRTQALTLALWSTFFPVGFAVGTMAAAVIDGSFGWRAATAVGGAAGVVVWIVVVATRRPVERATSADSRSIELTRRATFLGLGFGLFTFFEVGYLSLALMTKAARPSAGQAFERRHDAHP